MTKSVDNIFSEAGVSYWATAGTLLGIYRHQGIIPWDIDVDIGVWEGDVFLIEELSDQFQVFGLKIVPFFFGMKIVPLDSHNPLEPPFIDVFVFRPTPKALWTVLISEEAKEMFPQEWYCNLGMKLPTYQPFGSIEIKAIPLEDEGRYYLQRNFGADWYTVGKVYQPHAGGDTECHAETIQTVNLTDVERVSLR